MIRYNWEIVERYTKNDCTKILAYFNTLVFNTVYNRLSLQIQQNSRVKDSFIVNGRDLLENRYNATEIEICIYIKLASIRDYFDYKFNNILYLPIEYCEVDVNKLKYNRLLTINEKIITFKYE